MNIVMIHGQNHKGSSYHVGSRIVDHIQGDKSVTEFFLPQDLPHFCVGCYRCIEDESNCPFYAEKRRILDAVEAADLLVFTTPTYCMRASAPMKAWMDLTFTYWMVHRPRACMFRKRAVVVSTAAGSGTKSAIKDVTNMLFNWGVPYVKSYGVRVQAMNWEQVSAKRKAEIEAAAVKLANTLSVDKKPRVGIKTKAWFAMMRLMQKAGWGSGEAEKAYWQANGWLDKQRPWN